MNSPKEQIVASSRLSLRPAEDGDCELLWRWRNELNTRKWVFNSTYVPYQEHKAWFMDKLNSPDAQILVILDENKEAIGQVRLDISPDKSAEIGTSIEASQRNKGYGSAALKLACQYGRDEFNITRVIAHVKEGNQASITAFTKAGFRNKGSQDFKGHKAIEMVWEEKP